MPKPENAGGRALETLDERLGAFEASRTARPAQAGIGGAAGGGYRVLAQMLGGVFGGLGFGWLLDHYAHTGPWGVIGGLVLGAAASIYATVQTASRISARAAAELAARDQAGGAKAPVADDED